MSKWHIILSTDRCNIGSEGHLVQLSKLDPIHVYPRSHAPYTSLCSPTLYTHLFFLDEAHGTPNNGTGPSRAYERISRQSAYHLPSTGTPSSPVRFDRIHIMQKMAYLIVIWDLAQDL